MNEKFQAITIFLLRIDSNWSMVIQCLYDANESESNYPFY